MVVSLSTLRRCCRSTTFASRCRSASTVSACGRHSSNGSLTTGPSGARSGLGLGQGSGSGSGSGQGTGQVATWSELKSRVICESPCAASNIPPQVQVGATLDVRGALGMNLLKSPSGAAIVRQVYIPSPLGPYRRTLFLSRRPSWSYGPIPLFFAPSYAIISRCSLGAGRTLAAFDRGTS